MSVWTEQAGFDIDGMPVELYHIGDAAGLEAVVTNLGAAVVSIFLEREGMRTDVLLGFEHLKRQMEKGPMFGATLGRYAGKILNAEYEWKGRRILLSKSHGEHHAHGGCRGFDKRMFTTALVTEQKIVFLYRSPDGEEGYPGTLVLKVSYEAKGRSLILRYEACADQDTPVGISNHMYFNLKGNGSGSVAGHEAFIRSREIAEVDANKLPAGRLCSVEGTAMDLREAKKLADCLAVPTEQMKWAGGFDHDYLLDERNGEPAGGLLETETGTRMEVYTDMPCLHFYVADFGGMEYVGKGGAIYNGKCGVCFEPMYVSDCLHNGIGPAPILQAGKTRVNTTWFVFSW